jgi:hypothetical protein
MLKMCEPFNELDCLITMSTIGTPNATFVAQQVGDDLRFRGLAFGAGVSGVVAPTNITINAGVPPPTPINGVSGTTLEIDYSTISPALQPTEIPFTLGATNYSTGIFVGNTLTIPTSAYYHVSFNPNLNISVGLFFPQATFRMRNSSGVLYAEIYAKEKSADETTSSFCHVMFLPADDYQFTMQLTGLTAGQYDLYGSRIFPISVKRVSV